MKRYLVFSTPDYDALGGWAEFVGDFDTLEEAKAQLTGAWVTELLPNRTGRWGVTDDTRRTVDGAVAAPRRRHYWTGPENMHIVDGDIPAVVLVLHVDRDLRTATWATP